MRSPLRSPAQVEGPQGVLPQPEKDLERPSSTRLGPRNLHEDRDFPGGAMVKNPPANAGDARNVGLIPGSEDPLEKEMAIHSSTVVWKIPWMEEPDRLQSMGSQKVGHD